MTLPQFRKFLRRARPLIAGAAITSFIAGAFALIMLRAIKREALQQSAVETAVILAGHVRSDLEYLVRELAETGEGKFQKEREEARATGRDFTGDLEFDSDILDISVWNRPEGALKPQKSFQAINSDYVNPAQKTLLKSPSTEAIESDLIAPSFRGQVVVTLALGIDREGVGMISVPQGRGQTISEVIVGHFKLERFQRAFRWDGLTRAILVNADGMVLAHSGYKIQDTHESLSNHPLVQAMKMDTLAIGGGQLNYEDSRGFHNIGGYKRLNVGKLAVLASIPEQEAGLGIENFLSRGVLFMAVVAALAVAFGYAIAGGRRKPGAHIKFPYFAKAESKSSELEMEFSEPSVLLGPLTHEIPQQAQEEHLPQQQEQHTNLAFAKRRVVTVLHASVNQVHQLLESLGPEVAMTALNEFLTQAAVRVAQYGGEFEKGTGSSFAAVWSSEDSNARSIRCAIELRSDIIKLNALRKLDGEKPLNLAMGIDSGLALAGVVGPGAHGKFTVVGDVLACARKLDQLCEAAGTDLLVTQDAWEDCGSRFVGKELGQAKLSPASGLRNYHSIGGYVDEKGAEVIVPSSAPETPSSVGVESAFTDPHLVIPAKREVRWLVNNGSTIEGPLAVKEIAARLYAQELDFDCECWVDGSGKPASIGSCGMFSGSDDEGADLWIYDGETVHGPMSQGFLRTALVRGAIPRTWHVCEKSTIQGWQLLETWEAERVRAEVVPPPAPAAPEKIEIESPSPAVIAEASEMIEWPQVPETLETPPIPAHAPANEITDQKDEVQEEDSDLSWRHSA